MVAITVKTIALAVAISVSLLSPKRTKTTKEIPYLKRNMHENLIQALCCFAFFLFSHTLFEKGVVLFGIVAHVHFALAYKKLIRHREELDEWKEE